MSKRVERGTYHRSCRGCGWTGTYDTPARGDYAKRRHSCEKQLADAARKARGEAIRQAHAQIDRTPKPCLHKIAQHVHGTYACWTLDKCRCLACKDAQAAYESQRRRNNAYGRARYVDAQPARDHVRGLMDQGMGLKRIVAVSDVSQGALWKLVYGKRQADGTQRPSKRITRDLERRILAITVDLADGALVDATGSIRRVRALVALGWSQSKIAERLGQGRSNFHLGIGRRAQVTVALTKAVAVLYDELSMVLPPEDTHRDRIAASRARSHAKRHGWLPPLALDDELLDDPTYQPGSLDPEQDGRGLDDQAIYRRSHGDKSVRLTRDEAAELVRRWQSSGRSLAECERVTGVNVHRFKEVA